MWSSRAQRCIFKSVSASKPAAYFTLNAIDSHSHSAFVYEKTEGEIPFLWLTNRLLTPHSCGQLFKSIQCIVSKLHIGGQVQGSLYTLQSGKLQSSMEVGVAGKVTHTTFTESEFETKHNHFLSWKPVNFISLRGRGIGTVKALCISEPRHMTKWINNK